MQLTYIFHSGFAILGDNITVIIDYFFDSSVLPFKKGIVRKKLLKRPGKVYVLSTHHHKDHFNKKILSWKEIRPDIIYIFSKDILNHRLADPQDAIYLRKGDTYEDESLRIDTFGSTDAGVSYLIKLQGMTFFHAGDLNNWHWNEESTEKEIERAEKKFAEEVDFIKETIREIDVVMFPVDARLGKDYMKGPKEFIEQIKTVIFVPMHFALRVRKANKFRKIAHAMGCHFIRIRHWEQTFDITLY